MIELRKIITSDTVFSQAESLFLESFPSNEHRDLPEQRRNIDENPIFDFYVIESDKKFAGILSVWTFDNFRYVEHFAILPEKRSAGLGSQALQRFIDMCDLPIVLEVELPDDELKSRRVSFYQRHGLILWDKVDYFQPPYRKSDNIFPMKLMATKGLSPENDYESIKSHIYRHVYNYLI